MTEQINNAFEPRRRPGSRPRCSPRTYRSQAAPTTITTIQIALSTPHEDDSTPAERVQRNSVDPDSRVVLSRSGRMQAYNAQGRRRWRSPDPRRAEAGPPCAADVRYVVPMVLTIEDNVQYVHEELSPDGGYCSDANFEHHNGPGIRG